MAVLTTKVGGNDISKGRSWPNATKLVPFFYFPGYGDCFARLGK